jgi:hypothetical protein
MAGTGTLTLAAAVSGGPDGARSFGPFSVTTQAAVGDTLPVSLAVGANTVSLPTGTTWAIIVPPNATAPGTPNPNPGYGGTLTLKGVTGDTGVPLSIKWWTVLTFDAATLPASFVVTASATGTLTVVFG